MPKNMILTQFSLLAIETDRYGKILFKNMQVLLITRLSTAGQLNEVQFFYMHVIDK